MAILKYHPDLWLRDDAAAAINALEDKYGPIFITSAGRTVAQQQDLIDRYDAGDPNVYMPYRPPEGSPHVQDGGIAVDIYNFRDDRAKMEEFGFQWTYGMDDPVHYDFIGWNGSGGGSSTTNAQNFLDSLGYDTGAPGWGPLCEAATRDFQSRTGLVADGIFGPDTTGMQRLIENGHNSSSRSTSSVQTRLQAIGYNPGPVDNDWGNKTSLALLQYQRSQGLTADAIYGPESDARLFAEEVQNWNLTSRSTADIQRVVGSEPDGVWGPKTDADIRSWQSRKGIAVDGIWGITSDGLGFPPDGVFAFGIDYSFSRPAISKMKSAGVVFAVRYLWSPFYQDGRTNKGISNSEYQSLKGSQINVGNYYEEDSETPIRGFDEGVRQARAAEKYRIENNLPALPISFPVDRQTPDSEIPEILEGLRGAATVVGIERTWVYGQYSVVKAAFDAGVITGACQTYAWSHGLWDQRAQLRQWSNGQWDDSVDFVWAMSPEYGQTEVKATPTPEPNPGMTPEAAGFWQWLFDMIKGWFGGKK